MSSSSKIYLALLFLALSLSAQAVQLQAVYVSPCEREIGMILHTDKRFIFLLNLDGEVKKIGRYQIQSLSSYALDHLPLNGRPTIPEHVPTYRFSHHGDTGMKPLAEGIVLGSTKTGYQLLDFQGRDAYVPFQSIWKIEKTDSTRALELKGKQRTYSFAHPSKGVCPEQAKANVQTVYISELLTDPVVIKRHLDRQIAALRKVEKQREAQVFYPVPQLYKNRTQVGYWLPFGNRYGSAEGRNSGLAPLIRNEFSTGPFGYQHLSLTGAGPVPGSIHEEPQTMLYYGFKASYISFTGFIDPAIILAGSQYQWEKGDMDAFDNRTVESSHISLGFDRGAWSLKLFVHSQLFGGYRHDEATFSRYDGDMTRLMLTWQSRSLFGSLSTGLSSRLESKKDDGIEWSDGDMSFLRGDFAWQLPRNLKLDLWYIYRGVDFKAITGESFRSESTTLGIGLECPLSKRWSLAGRLSREVVTTTTESSDKDRAYYKFAAGAYLDF